MPAGVELAPGDLVTVPLGARLATGVTWAENRRPNPRLDNRMRDIEAKLDIPPLKPELRNFIDWVSAYTLSPRGSVLRMALRMGEHLGPARERVGVRLAGAAPKRMTPARERVLALLADGLARGKRDLAEEAAVSPGVVDGLVDEGTLEMTWIFAETAFRDRVVCRFEQGRVTVERSVNVNSSALSWPTLVGVRSERRSLSDS